MNTARFDRGRDRLSLPVILLGAVLCLSAAAVADAVPAIGAFDGEGISAAVAGCRVDRETLGWAFCDTRELEITALGFIDIGGEGFSTRHDLGLWKVGGELLASSALPQTLSPYCHVDGFGGCGYEL